MANTHNDLPSLFTAVADSIRTKKESTEKIIADDFPEEIRNLKTGFDYVNPMVTHIADSHFKNCEELRSVDCQNLASIGANAFEGCNALKKIIIPGSVVSIGASAFKGCAGTTIYCMFESQPEEWHESWNPDGCEVMWVLTPVEIWNASPSHISNPCIAELYIDIHNEGFYSLVISGTASVDTTYSSTKPAWYNYMSQINSVILNYGITSIGSGNFNCGMFQNCTSITDITVPESVSAIGENAFNGCTGLTKVTFLGKASIGKNAFRKCSNLSSITMPGGLKNISEYVFYYCKRLVDISISDDVTTIGEFAFANCESLTSITIPNSVTIIERCAFYECKSLTSVSISDSVTNIPKSAFYGCESLTSIAIPDSVTSITESAFYNCISLNSITLPNYLTYIGRFSFYGCSITSITIPNTIREICEYAFSSCRSLRNIVYTGTVAQWNAITFGTDWNTDTGNYTIHCTDGDIAKNGTITYHESNTGEDDA